MHDHTGARWSEDSGTTAASGVYVRCALKSKTSSEHVKL